MKDLEPRGGRLELRHVVDEPRDAFVGEPSSTGDDALCRLQTFTERYLASDDPVRCNARDKAFICHLRATHLLPHEDPSVSVGGDPWMWEDES